MQVVKGVFQTLLLGVLLGGFFIRNSKFVLGLERWVQGNSLIVAWAMIGIGVVTLVLIGGVS